VSAFIEVPAEAVPTRVQTAVARMLALVEPDLDLPPVRVRWFRWSETSALPRSADDLALRVLNIDRTDWAHLKGKALDVPIPTIWLHARLLPPAFAAGAAAHEARHIWQARTWTSADDHESDRRIANAEPDAYQYQARMMRLWALGEEDDNGENWRP
jgi:hypothetical protein